MLAKPPLFFFFFKGKKAGLTACYFPKYHSFINDGETLWSHDLLISYWTSFYPYFPENGQKYVKNKPWR